MRLLLIAAIGISFVLAFFGLTFLFSPTAAFDMFAHSSEGLPRAFGGRYIGLGILLAVFAILKDLRALAIFCFVGGLLGFIDFGIYLWMQHPMGDTVQHAIAGVVATSAGLLFFKLYRDTSDKLGSKQN